MKKLLFGIFLWMMLPVLSAEVCSEDSCVLPGDSGGSLSFRVLLPVADSAVPRISQAPRLTTLSGKTIAIVGGSFMARVTHPELKRLILQDYPDARVILLNEIGSAGPWPMPGVVRHQYNEFIERLRQFGVDAVISGNGGCGLCTPKECGSCIAAEYCGIPAVMIAAPGFDRQAHSVAANAGIPVLRVAVYPGAFSAHSTEELLENTRNILYPQIIRALISPISDDEVSQTGGTSEREFTGTYQEINRYFADNGWSDGLPIVPPTRVLVDEFLKFSVYPADMVVATVPPANRKITAEMIAVNGAMSGCPPEFMPILIAFTQAMTNGDFRRTLASTHAWTPYCWINGPLARQLGIDHAQGEISHQRNALIGRFINLAMLNFGGYYIKQNRMGTFGYLMPWCLAEDEQRAVAIGWLPYHMQMGYQLNESTLTASSALNWGNNLTPATSDPLRVMELIAMDAVEKEQFALGSGTPFVFRTFLITGSVAEILAGQYRSKRDFENALIATALRPVMERVYANYWANPGSSFDPATYPLSRHAVRISRQENSRKVAVPEYLRWTALPEIEMVPVMQAGKSAILITGDASRNKSMCLPGGGYVTIRIPLPENWDELMCAKGYEPLTSFFLSSDLVPERQPSRFQNYPRH